MWIEGHLFILFEKRLKISFHQEYDLSYVGKRRMIVSLLGSND